MGKHAQRLWGWIGRMGRQELATLLGALLLAGAIWAFVEIADRVVEGRTGAFDKRVLLAMREPGHPQDPRGPRWLEEVLRDLTALGGIAVLTLLALASAGFLLFEGKRHAAVLLLVAVASGLGLSLALKSGFDRPRPDLVPHGSVVMTPSFPSGHSMMSAVTYLTLGAILARVQERRRLKAYLLGLALLLTFCVGVSRVYLGVHWPTDVLAGWTAGAAWALLCSLVARWLQRRGQVESDLPNQEKGPP